MKKALAVLVLLGTISVCSSAFGYILEYKLVFPMKGFDVANEYTAIKASMKGFLVMQFDEDNNDALADASLVIYGTDPDKETGRVYTVLNQSDENAFLSATVTPIFDVDDDPEVADRVAIDLFANDPFGFEIFAVGKLKSINVGSSASPEIVDAASSIKGVSWMPFGVLINPDEDITATGSATLSLFTGATREINTSEGTLADAVAEITNTLGDRGYQFVLVEPPAPAE